jgi:hypothetical protein
LFIPLQERLTVDGSTDYRQLFLWPAAMSLAAAVLLLVAFWPPRTLAAASDTRDDLETEPELAR